MILLSAVAWLAFCPTPPVRAVKLDDSNKAATQVCAEFDPAVAFKRKAGCSGWASRAGNKIWMSYNSMGLRDKDYPPLPPPGAARALFIGGSLTAGSGLEEKDSPPRVFERGLRRRGLPVEVVNATGEGYTGWQNAVRLKQYLDAYSPQFVVYHLSAHYIFTDRALWDDLRVNGAEILGRKNPFRVLPKFLQILFSDSRFWGRRRVHFILRFYLEQWGRIRASRELAAADPEQGLKNLLGPTLRELEQMQSRCRAAGARLYVIYDGAEVNADQYLLIAGPSWPARFAHWVGISPFRFEGAIVEKRLREEAAKLGFEVLSLARDRTSLTDPAHRLARDYHWNVRGSEIFGEAAAREFLPAQKRG